MLVYTRQHAGAIACQDASRYNYYNTQVKTTHHHNYYNLRMCGEA